MSNHIAKDFLQPKNGWIQINSKRLNIPTPAESGLLFRGVSKLSGMFGRSGIPDIFSVLNVNPSIFWPWLFFASRMMPYGKLAAIDRELIILRMAWLCRCRYEWGQHVELGLKAGLTDEQIINITRGASGFNDLQKKVLIQACDELHINQFIETETWQLLSQNYKEDIIIEITMLAGHYQMLAGFLNSAGVRLEADIEIELDKFHTRIKDVKLNE